MKIAIDCSGGDKAPKAPIEGALLAQKELGVDIVFVGNEQQIQSHVGSNAHIVPSQNDITNEDKALDSVKHKKNSSMVLGLKMLKNQEVNAFVSAGNTGALVAASTLYVGRLEGVLRPALATLLPTKKGVLMLIDAGANLECKPEFLHQFGIMGAIYMKNMHGASNPKVGLLNVGAEEEKGLENIKEAAKLLSNASNYNFIGNVEARDFANDVCDVLVSEGFSGNVMLKSIEGVASFVKNELKEAIFSSWASKIGGALLKKSFNNMLDKMDYTKHGGAPLLGTNGTVIKAHGSSNAMAFYNAIRQAKSFSESMVNEKIVAEFRENTAI